MEENAAFAGFADGTLTLQLRAEQWRPIVREHLRDVDFVSVLPGFRRFDVTLGEEGRTGREARNEHEARRLAAAIEAAEASPHLKRLVALLGGRVEQIEPSTLDGDVRSERFEEKDDD